MNEEAQQTTDQECGPRGTIWYDKNLHGQNDHEIKPNLNACDQAGLVYKPGSRRLAGLETLTDAENSSGSKG